MRRVAVAVCLVLLAMSAYAQPRPRIVSPGSARADSAERFVKQAAEQVAEDSKSYERDLLVLRRLKTADKALTDPMQPSVAVQKAYEEVEAVKGLSSDFRVNDGVIRVFNELEAARKSPGTADFGRLRAILREDGLEPASRVVVRIATGLQEEIVAWLRVQQRIGENLGMLSSISSECLRAAQP